MLVTGVTEVSHLVSLVPQRHDTTRHVPVTVTDIQAHRLYHMSMAVVYSVAPMMSSGER